MHRHRVLDRIVLSIALVVAPLVTRCQAGTIRDDRSDKLYTALAGQPQFAASGYLQILVAGVPVGVASGTLIDPEWVLTAGHCVIGEDGPAGTSWTFQIGSQVVTVPPENVFVPVEYVTSGFDSGFDVALLRLPVPVRGVRPAVLSTATDELRKVITTLGYGTTGDGDTGNTLPAGTRRAGQNTIDAFTSLINAPGYAQPPIRVGSERTLLYDFDNPQRTASTIGSATPLNLEYSGAPGDSGGGAFLLSSGGCRVIGVVSAGISPNGLAQSCYGTTAIYARVSQNVGWIRAAMTGRAIAMPTLLAQAQQGTLQRAADVSRQRAAAYARQGFRLMRLIAVPSLHPIVPSPSTSPLAESQPSGVLGLREAASAGLRRGPASHQE